MISYADAAAALTIGLMGSSHCAAMCGGIAGAVSLGIDEQRQNRVLAIAAFHLGRILSYALIGLALGSVVVYAAAGFKPLSIALRIIAAGLLISMGLYIAGWWRGLTMLERVGVPLWSRLQPLTKRLLPVRSAAGALLLGGLWGWLPCGLVYSTLSWAVSADSTLGAAGRMLFFGIGTLPAMLTMSLAAETSRRLLQKQSTRRVAGILLIGFGLWTLVTPIQQLSGGHDMSGHQHRH